MNRLEKYEVSLITVCIVLMVSHLSGLFPSTIKLGTLVLYCFALLLFQGLIRDLYYYISHRKRKRASSSPSNGPCICLESSLGVIGILLGAMVTFSSVDFHLSLRPWSWTMIVSVVLILGFLLKDWVFHWQPLGLRREKDHMNVIFTLKK